MPRPDPAKVKADYADCCIVTGDMGRLGSGSMGSMPHAFVVGQVGQELGCECSMESTCSIHP